MTEKKARELNSANREELLEIESRVQKNRDREKVNNQISTSDHHNQGSDVLVLRPSPKAWKQHRM